MIDHDVYTNQNVNVCTDASSMTRCVQLNQTKCTSSKSSKEEKQICDIITSYDNFIETQSNQKLPKRLYSLEEMNKDHKQYIKLIKSKVSKLNACELLTQSQIRLRNPKTSHSQTRKALKRKCNVSTKSKLLCKSEIKVKRRSQRDGVKILIKNSQSNESDRCIYGCGPKSLLIQSNMIAKESIPISTPMTHQLEAGTKTHKRTKRSVTLKNSKIVEMLNQKKIESSTNRKSKENLIVSSFAKNQPTESLKITEVDFTSTEGVKGFKTCINRK